LILNFDASIEWAENNRTKIDAAKEKTKENKKTKARPNLDKQSTNSGKKLNKLTASACKLQIARKGAEAEEFCNSIL
jgi:hypothetical protein